jgi:hypothetical protein
MDKNSSREEMMTRGKGVSRKANRNVRKPATKFAHLQKRMQKTLKRGGPATKK